MSSILLNMIHNRAEATKPDTDITVKNYGIWVKHWFNVAEDLIKEFNNAGLTKTADAVHEIVIEQRKYCKEYLE